jgi:hypothetical protein
MQIYQLLLEVGRRILIRTFTLFIMIGWTAQVVAQDYDSTEVKRKKLEVRGYVKDLQSLTFSNNFDSLVTGNLIHNRVNVRWNPTDRITGAIEFRNRLFWGEEVRLTPNFSSNLTNNNEAVNVSVIWFETESMVLQTNIDRFWMEYHGKTWEARLGRQRINWGISTVWNPNDIFNTYNFLDFDYEERPGRDAVKVTYHVNEMSNLELAAAAADQANKAVASVRYFTNRWNYDFQFSSGVYHEIFTMGAGWSGSIKDAGFKGEMQYFAPHRDTAAQVNLSAEVDYVFAKGWYLNGGFLLNSNGINAPVDDWGLVYFRLTPQSLMPTKWNMVVTVVKELTPLLSANLSTIYSPGTSLLILLPSVKYNLATNVDFDLVWQSFFAEQYNQFAGVSHRAFLRIKWNF